LPRLPFFRRTSGLFPFRIPCSWGGFYPFPYWSDCLTVFPAVKETSDPFPFPFLFSIPHDSLVGPSFHLVLCPVQFLLFFRPGESVDSDVSTNQLFPPCRPSFPVLQISEFRPLGDSRCPFCRDFLLREDLCVKVVPSCTLQSWFLPFHLSPLLLFS